MPGSGDHLHQGLLCLHFQAVHGRHEHKQEPQEDGKKKEDQLDADHGQPGVLPILGPHQHLQLSAGYWPSFQGNDAGHD